MRSTFDPKIALIFYLHLDTWHGQHNRKCTDYRVCFLRERETCLGRCDVWGLERRDCIVLTRPGRSLTRGGGGRPAAGAGGGTDRDRAHIRQIIK